MTARNHRTQRPSRGPWMWKKAKVVPNVEGANKVCFDVAAGVVTNDHRISPCRATVQAISGQALCSQTYSACCNLVRRGINLSRRPTIHLRSHIAISRVGRNDKWGWSTRQTGFTAIVGKTGDTQTVVLRMGLAHAAFNSSSTEFECIRCRKSAETAWGLLTCCCELPFFV